MPIGVPNLPTAGIDLPRFTPIGPLTPGIDLTAGSSAPDGTPLLQGVQKNAATPAVISPDVGRHAVLRTPPATDPGSVAGRAAEPGLATPWWTQLGQLGSLGSLGSGQTLNGFAFGVSAALGLLLLFLLPPPFRVSRLHLAAVFWRPQRFVGPLVPPG